MKNAKVTTTIQLLSGEPDVVNTEEFQYEEDKELMAMQMSRILQIYMEGGLTEVTSLTRLEATPVGAIKKIIVDSVPSLITLDNNVDKAAEAERRKKMADAMMRQPLEFKKPV